jgi:hypothetical protein
VAMVFSSDGPRRSDLGAKLLVDRLAAGVLGLLGMRAGSGRELVSGTA